MGIKKAEAPVLFGLLLRVILNDRTFGICFSKLHVTSYHNRNAVGSIAITNCIDTMYLNLLKDDLYQISRADDYGKLNGALCIIVN